MERKFLSLSTYSRISKKPSIYGLPISLSVEPTTSCNLRCTQCPSGLRSFTRPTGMLDLIFYKKLIDEQSPTLFYLNLYFQGEPFLNSNFFEMIAYANSKRIYTSTSTNAHYLHIENALKTVKSGLDRIIISLDGNQQESYEKYRIGGKIDLVFSGIYNLIEAKKKLNSSTPHIIIQNIIFRHNENEVSEIKSRFKNQKVELQFKTAQIYDFENGSDLIPVNQKYTRYESTNAIQYKINNQQFNHCWKMWHSSVVTWDGKIVPCCFDKDAHFKLGDLNQSSFKTIWQSIPYNNFRNQLLNNRKEVEICQNCTEGTKTYI